MQRATGISTSYVQSLEDRVKTLEAQLRESNAHASPQTGAGTELMVRAIRGFLIPPSIAEELDSLSLSTPGTQGFQGASSQARLVKAVVDLKSSYTNAPSTSRGQVPLTSKLCSIRPVGISFDIPLSEDTNPRPKYTFPDDDLMISLISLYFNNINDFFPLLHRPTFERAHATSLHLRDDGFGGTLLLVCALGARYSDDPRVRQQHHPAGMEWFAQVQLFQALSSQPTLYDLQCYCLAVQFLERTSGARASWTLVGVGIRLAQDIGTHRLNIRARVATPEEELQKRAYWLMVLFDSQL
ncbi:fungal-specific transcription factor domain-containing protein, partial [Mycena rosella]